MSQSGPVHPPSQQPGAAPSPTPGQVSLDRAESNPAIKPEPHVLGALVQAMLFCAIREGLDANDLLAQAGLTLAEIEPLHKAVLYNKVLALVRAIDQQRPNINLGLMMGMKLTTSRMGPLGFVLTSAPTFGRALQDFVKFQGLLNGGLVRWKISMQTGAVAVTLNSDPALADIAWILEAPLALILTIARELLGQHVVPLQVSFHHAPRAEQSEHDSFFGVPVRWSAPDNEIILSDALLELPVHTANTGLYPHLLHHVDTQRRQPAPSPAIDAVQRHIRQILHEGPPLKDSVARAVGMSARTLFRRLAEANTTFDALLDRTRRELALHYLADPRIAIAQVAEKLGYSEASPFFRAFVRWFGCTPAEYRARTAPRL